MNLLNNPYSDMEDLKMVTAKVYYSFKDHLILIPLDCENSTYYKPCVIEHINQDLQTISAKYGLKK